jgi:hypothetical protein
MVAVAALLVAVRKDLRRPAKRRGDGIIREAKNCHASRACFAARQSRSANSVHQSSASLQLVWLGENKAYSSRMHQPEKLAARR